jgi:transcriptional regulator with XRE-family HTH domain
VRSRGRWAPDTVPPVARKKHPPISAHDKRTIGATLREIRRAAGYRAVERAADVPSCPASRQTIYAYERGGLVPSLPQFLELVEFYVLQAPLPPAPGSAAKSETDLRALGIAAVTRALALPAYHVAQAHDLIARMQPELGRRS